MIAAFDWQALVPIIISTLFGGGLVALITALYKVKPEAGQIVVTAAQGALIVQTGVIENLRTEIERISKEAEEKIGELQSALKQANVEIIRLNDIIGTMKVCQDRHELEVKDLQNGRQSKT